MKWSMAALMGAVLALSGLCVESAAPQKPAGDAGDAKIITNSIGMKLAPIPAGKFQMGSPADEAERDQGEIQHEVTITKSFYIGVYEVTQREFDQVMPTNVKRGSIFNQNRGGGPDHPAENVTWKQAGEFCKNLTIGEEMRLGRRYRLPTEAEWEYACRAGTTTPFHFGNSLSSKQANFNGKFPFGKAEQGPYLRMTAKIGSYPANAWGLHDMHGNVWEWCADYHDKDYYRNSPKEDPKGPEKGVVSTDYVDYFRVIRGGSWLDDAQGCRSAYRYRAMPEEPNRLIGFRVVCEVENKAP
jgi:formylglycine-generating enzyme required for sulfatase activity